MTYIALSVFIVIVIAIIINVTNKDRREKKLNKIKASWRRIKDEDFDFELIENYSRLNIEPFFHDLSEQTMKDIDFYDVFCIIDRTTSRVGQQFLFNKFKKPLDDISALEKFNQQIIFFSEDQETRERVQQQLIRLSHQDSYYITSLLQSKLISRPGWLHLAVVNSLLVIFLIALLPFYPPALLWLVMLFAINLFLHFKNKNNTFQFIKSFPQLNLLINIADKLCKEDIPFEKKDTINSIHNLRGFQKKFRLLSFGQNRSDDLGQIFWLFLELIKALFLVEIHAFYKLIKVMDDKQQDILTVYQFIGNIDSCISVASLRAGVQNTCQPEFTGKVKKIYARDIYHPLIPDCVANSISISSRSILITGSNMSGKTTFLRTIAINSLLAQTIFTCYASAFETPVLKLFSSIRIDDDLLQGKSYYLAEVDAMRSLIEESSSSYQNLFLLDEVFKGTNTVERIASAKAILSYLNRHQNIVIVSTHDLELSDLLLHEYDLFHFEETIVNDELIFDHLLKEGPLKTRNAIRILGISNYPAEIIDEANAISKKLIDDKLG